MKVLFVIDNMQAGGMQKIVTFLANGMTERGFSVSVCSYASEQRHFKMNDDVIYYPGTAYTGGHYMRHIRKIKEVKKIIRKDNPDVVICFNSIPTMIAIIATRNMNIPVIYCERGDPYQLTNFISKAKNYLAQKADWFVFQTIQAKEYFSTRVQQKSTVIPNPVTITSTEQIPYDERVNEIAFVARFDIHQKRQDLMVDAFEIIHKRVPEIRLCFYGDGDDFETICDMVEKKGLSEYVHFAGMVSNVIDSIKASKLFILSSDFEGIPNALIEAMSAGVPCVSTDCSPGGAKLLVENKVNGLLVPCGDAEAIANAAIYMLEHEEEAQYMGKKAQGICEEYSPDKILSIWCEMLNRFEK